LKKAKAMIEQVGRVTWKKDIWETRNPAKRWNTWLR